MTGRYKNILVPLNFSEQNDKALEAVADIIGDVHVTLTLMHVIEPISVSDDSETADFLSQLRDNAQEALQERKKRFEGLDVAVTCENRVGNRTRELITYADDNNVDLIVLSSHPLRGSEPSKFVASISYQVAVLANCAILLLK
ncbi:MAG: universal stress protein [bacterium]|nr:universal stress protein [Gammaproteobacteria bacterium]HIL98879.1 universal stress protein [Pseudomonadales bacterium]